MPLGVHYSKKKKKKKAVRCTGDGTCFRYWRDEESSIILDKSAPHGNHSLSLTFIMQKWLDDKMTCFFFQNCSMLMFSSDDTVVKMIQRGWFKSWSMSVKAYQTTKHCVTVWNGKVIRTAVVLSSISKRWAVKATHSGYKECVLAHVWFANAVRCCIMAKAEPRSNASPVDTVCFLELSPSAQWPAQWMGVLSCAANVGLNMA